jgi:hypothetical protein
MVRQIPLKAYTDTYTYSLFLLSALNHHSSCFSSFICDCNTNGFMKGNQRVSLYWHSRCFSESLGGKYNDLVRMLRHYYKHVYSFQKIRNISSSCWMLYFLNGVIIIPFIVNVTISLNNGL